MDEQNSSETRRRQQLRTRVRNMAGRLRKAGLVNLLDAALLELCAEREDWLALTLAIENAKERQDNGQSDLP